MCVCEREREREIVSHRRCILSVLTTPFKNQKDYRICWWNRALETWSLTVQKKTNLLLRVLSRKAQMRTEIQILLLNVKDIWAVRYMPSPQILFLFVTKLQSLDHSQHVEENATQYDWNLRWSALWFRFPVLIRKLSDKPYQIRCRTDITIEICRPG
jgi:hypothetical protein